jgi:outer membrane protein OmpA-like peptidoglycan-associated protein
LDTYKPVSNVQVTFGFDKAVLTKDDKDQLDTFAAQVGTAKSSILEVTGGTDSTGPAQYNYDLSQRRADAVVQYLASKYGIPAHRFYLIGIGKDKEVAPNTTAEGRKQNRRVEVQMLSNMGGEQTATSGGAGAAGSSANQ